MASEVITWPAIREALLQVPAGSVYALPTRGAVLAGSLLYSELTPDPVEADVIFGDPRDALSAGISNLGRVWWPFGEDVVFPWESGDREARLTAIGRDLLRTVGADLRDEGLRDTPTRWARWWTEFLDYHPSRTDTAFALTQTDHLVVIGGIRTWSLCEHHLLPFAVEATVGYAPAGRVLGLSKFARLVERSARRLQLQERIGDETADAVMAATKARDVIVVLRGRHLCMEARGARVAAVTTSVASRGQFRLDRSLRAEVFALAGGTQGMSWVDIEGSDRAHGEDAARADDQEPLRLPG